MGEDVSKKSSEAQGQITALVPLLQEPKVTFKIHHRSRDTREYLLAALNVWQSEICVTLSLGALSAHHSGWMSNNWSDLKEEFHQTVYKKIVHLIIISLNLLLLSVSV